MTKRGLFCFLGALVAFSLLSPSISFAACCKLFLKWKTVKTEHFAINYYEGEEEVARKLVPISEEVYQTMTDRFHVQPSGRTEVIILSHHDNAKSLATPIPYNIIMVRTSPPPVDNPMGDYDNWLKQLFMHEYANIVHIADTGYPAKILKPIFGSLVVPNALAPNWATEGLATYFETTGTTRGRGRSSFTDMVLRTDILHHSFLGLDQMAGTQYEWPGEQAPFIYGVGFWKYIAEVYGEERIVQFSHRLGSSLSLFRFNHHAKKVFLDPEGHERSFQQLWQDWKKSLEEKYAQGEQRVKAEGLQEGESLFQPKKGENHLLPTLSPDGRFLAYLMTSVHHHQELRLRNLATGEEKVLYRKQDIHQIAFSPDGERLIFSYVSAFRGFCKFSDIYQVTLKTGQVEKLTRAERARDADFSPDGKKLILVVQNIPTSTLSLLDLETKTIEPLLEAEGVDQPRWLPDGKSILVSLHRQGQRDLWVIHTDTHQEKRITDNVSLESSPFVDSVHQVVYFSSDKTGISNLYRYDLKEGRVSRITNVLTGAFSPSVSSDGRVVFQYYNGSGFEIRQLVGRETKPVSFPDTILDTPANLPPLKKMSLLPETFKKSDPLQESRDYSSFPKVLIPHFVVPKVALLDGSLFASLSAQNFDPIRRHLWHGDVTYRNANKFIGFDVGYTYNRFLAPLTAGYNDYTVNYGDVFDLGENFFEERRRGFFEVATPPAKHQLSLSYFFEQRSENRGLPPGSVLLTLGHYAGFLAQYSYRNVQTVKSQTNPEEGVGFNANYEVSSTRLGGSKNLEQQVVWGDSRAYIPLPFDHHVLALRAAGGAAVGDLFIQGNFSLGGSAGEGPFTKKSSRLFTLRGLPLVAFSKDRAWVSSAEYRIPLFHLQRGPGTLPIYLNNTHIAFFADVGDAWDSGETSFKPLLGVGSEIRDDLIIGYHLPLTFRLGYGIILTNRGRLTGINDGLTGSSARNGVIVLDIGTSF